MGWWSAQSNDYRLLLVELANTKNSRKGKRKERGDLFRLGRLLRVFRGFHPIPERRCALRFKASAATI
jgi:hypothetical protein